MHITNCHTHKHTRTRATLATFLPRTRAELKGAVNACQLKNAFYTLRPLGRVFGAEVQGVDLQKVEFAPAFVAQVRKDLVQHRVLLFRKQILTGKRQVLK